VESCDESQRNSNGPAANKAGEGNGTLPFTGSSVLLMTLAGIGLSLLGLGFKAGLLTRRDTAGS
jgi:hypothetical protein